jgi:hypothetical protein
VPVLVSLAGLDKLNRRHPDRAKMRPADPAAFRGSVDTILERLWRQTVHPARGAERGMGAPAVHRAGLDILQARSL